MGRCRRAVRRRGGSLPPATRPRERLSTGKRFIFMISPQRSKPSFLKARRAQERFGVRTLLCAPLLREGVPLGLILIRRTEVRPFTDKQIKLLETFARPSCHRHRERPAVQRTRYSQPPTHRSFGAADGDERDSARDRQLADGYSAGAEYWWRKARRGFATLSMCRFGASTESGFDSLLIMVRFLFPRSKKADRSFEVSREEEQFSIERLFTFPTLWRQTSRLNSAKLGRSPKRVAQGHCWPPPCSAKGLRLDTFSFVVSKPGRSQTIKSLFLKPSPTRLSSPSKTSGCSKSSRSCLSSKRQRVKS